jgi:hypothetical protein
MSGTYTVVPEKSTGSFKGATGHGAFAVTLSGTGPIQAKATTCSGGNNGPNISGIKNARSPRAQNWGTKANAARCR